ncbi:hypothetical protein BC828DRAFT_173369 [Blastocladiella britannica]|nr:hypothetical protein BC828DRAFT_173369 [Blastocladiella britannica]
MLPAPLHPPKPKPASPPARSRPIGGRRQSLHSTSTVRKPLGSNSDQSSIPESESPTATTTTATTTTGSSPDTTPSISSRQYFSEPNSSDASSSSVTGIEQFVRDQASRLSQQQILPSSETGFPQVAEISSSSRRQSLQTPPQSPAVSRSSSPPSQHQSPKDTINPQRHRSNLIVSSIAPESEPTSVIPELGDDHPQIAVTLPTPTETFEGDLLVRRHHHHHRHPHRQTSNPPAASIDPTSSLAPARMALHVSSREDMFHSTTGSAVLSVNTDSSESSPSSSPPPPREQPTLAASSVIDPNTASSSLAPIRLTSTTTASSRTGVSSENEMVPEIVPLAAAAMGGGGGGGAGKVPRDPLSTGTLNSNASIRAGGPGPGGVQFPQQPQRIGAMSSVQFVGDSHPYRASTLERAGTAPQRFPHPSEYDDSTASIPAPTGVWYGTTQGSLQRPDKNAGGTAAGAPPHVSSPPPHPPHYPRVVGSIQATSQLDPSSPLSMGCPFKPQSLPQPPPQTKGTLNRVISVLTGGRQEQRRGSTSSSSVAMERRLSAQARIQAVLTDVSTSLDDVTGSGKMKLSVVPNSNMRTASSIISRETATTSGDSSSLQVAFPNGGDSIQITKSARNKVALKDEGSTPILARRRRSLSISAPSPGALLDVHLGWTCRIVTWAICVLGTIVVAAAVSIRASQIGQGGNVIVYS